MGALNINVTSSSGRGKKGVRVVGEVTGFFGGMTKEQRTDANGHVMISWSSSTSSLGAIYINGKKYSGKYLSGSSYSFSA